MSDLERSFAKARLSKLPPEPIPIFDEEEEDEMLKDSEDGPEPSPTASTDSSSSASSTGTIKPSPTRNLFQKPPAFGSRSKSGPLPWHDFFAQELTLTQQSRDIVIRHHAYLTPNTHTGPLIVTHHGAGSSGLSFAAFSREIQALIPGAGVLSLDARGHGQTLTVRSDDATENNVQLDLSLSVLAHDLAFVVNAVRAQVGWSQLPDILLIGHSLGGAVITEVVHQDLLGNVVLGYGVLDVVEGSAIDALQSMEHYLSTRPTSFPSLVSGIEWHTRSRTIRNSISARVSVPSLLQEESDQRWTWRTDLQATKPFWQDWFVGLSKKFLQGRGGKLLILAGTDRLDKELMIGQMQGKYQLSVFPEAGHFVHEDQPEKTAQVVADFYRRNDRTALVLPPKVDDLIKQGKLRPNKSTN